MILAVIVAALIVAFAFLNPLHLSLAVGVSGVTVTGIGQVAVQSNWQGVSGPWWLASIALGGGQTLNVQNLGGASYSASYLNTNSSYVCGTSCQSDNMQITATKSFLKYTAQTAGTLVNEYYIAYAGNGNINIGPYQSCVGAVPGSFTSATTTSGQIIQFSTCLYGGPQTYINYGKACTAAGGIPLNQYQGSQWVGCYQLNTISYANVYGLTSAAPEYTVQVKLNNQQTSISNNMSSNTTNQNIWIYNVGSGFTTQSSPSETTVSLIQYLPLTGNIGGFTQSIPAYTVNIEGNGGQGVLGTIGSCENVLTGSGGAFPTATNYATAQAAVNATNNCIKGAFHQSYVNTQFANSSIIYGSGGWTSLQGPVIGIMLPDPSMLYTRPNIVLAIKASQVGLYLGITNISLQSGTARELQERKHGYRVCANQEYRKRTRGLYRKFQCLGKLFRDNLYPSLSIRHIADRPATDGSIHHKR